MYEANDILVLRSRVVKGAILEREVGCCDEICVSADGSEDSSWVYRRRTASGRGRSWLYQ